MSPHALLHDGYVSLYMDLQNTGSEPLTFINTLYDTEPTKLYDPDGRLPVDRWVGRARDASGTVLPEPCDRGAGSARGVHAGRHGGERYGTARFTVANIKFCPTRAWTTSHRSRSRSTMLPGRRRTA
jgi:hypothetical protein